MLEPRLRVIPLFRDLPDGSLKSIATRLRRQRYPQGAVIFREGDAGDAMYVVESGQLEVTAGIGDSEHPLAYLGPGSFVGEIALLLDQPRSATLKVVIDADLWVLHKHDLEELLAEYPAIALHFTRELGQRLVTTSHQASPPSKTPITCVWGDFWYELLGAELSEEKVSESSLGSLERYPHVARWGELYADPAVAAAPAGLADERHVASVAPEEE